MNKRFHRVVWNAARKLKVVVQETARAAGKASGATPALTAVLLSAMPGTAQIVGAPGVPPNLRPTVLVAPNGVPLVNIQTPSAAGVSRNLYNQFDVQRNGVILNNSRTNVQTQLGGWVQGNPFLATGPARIILNEIVSGNPTQLRGAIEVGGQRAEVIVANSVEWQRVKEEHDRWSYHQSGMGPVTALVVSLVAAYVAAPMAAQAGAAAGSSAALATGEGVALSGGGVFLGASAPITAGVSAAVKVGVTALASRAAVSLVNNDGDLGRVLQEMGRSESVKAIVTSMLTAGVIDGLGASGLLPENIANATNGSARFTDQLQRQLIDNVAGSVVRSAVNGTSLEDELRYGLANALLNTVAAQGAFGIGDLKANGTLDAFTSQVAHAIVGCAVGAGRASAGRSGDAATGCSSGAVGAVVGGLTAHFMLANGPQDPASVSALSGLMGGIAGAILGGDPANASIAAAAGGNAAENNECQHTRMCGSDSTRVEIQGNIAAGALGTITDPDSIHLSVSISNAYSGLTTVDGQPRPGVLSDAMNSTPQIGIYCRLCLNSNIEDTPKQNIVWGPYSIGSPAGQTTTAFANSLIDTASSYYNGTIPYSVPITPDGQMGGARYNSNSWAAGILRSVTGSVPTYNFSPYIAPGYQNPIPSVWYRSR